jgi:hypothetical protein
MKLIKEISQELKYLTEASENGKKGIFIEGIFMQADKENKNGRLYPKGIMEKELQRYQSLISEKRSLGELGHPPNPTINLDKVSHLITNLRFEGNDIVGKAKILDTPMGKIAQNFIEEGVRLGVSSRGLGSLKERNGINEVQDDFHLATVDIVADPSAPDAFVQGIMESSEWILENGVWKAVDVERAQKKIKNASKASLAEAKLQVFESFLNKIK